MALSIGLIDSSCPVYNTGKCIRTLPSNTQVLASASAENAKRGKGQIKN